MKLVSAIVRPSKLDDVLEALSAIGVTGFTTTEVRGFGGQGRRTEVYRGVDYEVEFEPKVKIDTAVSDDLLAKVIETVGQSARTGKVGDGKIVVSALKRVVRVRTGETDVAAL
jgi:nitrogen regulatory protein P-II 2